MPGGASRRRPPPARNGDRLTGRTLSQAEAGPATNHLLLISWPSKPSLHAPCPGIAEVCRCQYRGPSQMRRPRRRLFSILLRFFKCDCFAFRSARATSVAAPRRHDAARRSEGGGLAAPSWRFRQSGSAADLHRHRDRFPPSRQGCIPSRSSRDAGSSLVGGAADRCRSPFTRLHHGLPPSGRIGCTAEHGSGQEGAARRRRLDGYKGVRRWRMVRPGRGADDSAEEDCEAAPSEGSPPFLVERYAVLRRITEEGQHVRRWLTGATRRSLAETAGSHFEALLGVKFAARRFEIAAVVAPTYKHPCGARPRALQVARRGAGWGLKWRVVSPLTTQAARLAIFTMSSGTGRSGRPCW